MKSWSRPTVPRVAGTGPLPSVYDSASDAIIETRPASTESGEVASLYVCGITPYDATHLGHAATYLAFDTLIRLWLDAGVKVRYAQNTTDVDDPLLERATRDGVDWRQLAAEQTDLFRSDMEHLRIIPPDHYVAVTEVVEEIAGAVHELLAGGTAYPVESEGADSDLYFDSSADAKPWFLGQESRLDRSDMLRFSAERGGDPARPGKRDALDPLLWRSEREGEPAWDTVLGRGRPGWHIECSVIALTFLPRPLTVSGGGADLLFPHHEFSAGHASALTGEPYAGAYVHSGMVAYEGEKMSKSLGNLVLVSRLVAGGADPRAIRLALLTHHYREDWEWTDDQLGAAAETLARWDAWAAGAVDDGAAKDADPFVDHLREILSLDLDTPGAITAIDERLSEPASTSAVAAIDALLGLQLVVE
ncbi:MAG: mshC [Microbacteriaceae bacterium]|nr:mshC [Microbacteriaceae bacterium]